MQLAARGQIVLRYTDDVNGSLGNVAGVVNEAGNVLGLMPHPEHAVDPLLGSADGGLLLAALVDAAAEHLLRPRRSACQRSCRPAGQGPPPAASRRQGAVPRFRSVVPTNPARLPRTGARSSAARSRSTSRARIVTGPRLADPWVVYAKRTSRSPLAGLEQLDDDREALVARPLRNGHLLDDRGRAPRSRRRRRSRLSRRRHEPRVRRLSRDAW